MLHTDLTYLNQGRIGLTGKKLKDLLLTCHEKLTRRYLTCGCLEENITKPNLNLRKKNPN
jgi:hypothetical protein